MYAVEYNAAIQNNNMYLLSGKMLAKYYHRKDYKTIWIT